MKGHSSSMSCFYCLSEETLYKRGGVSRKEQRYGNLTVLDSKNGENGFSSKSSKVVEVIAPYNTPIDILHNTGEGLFDRIREEIFPPDTKFIRKSDLFVIDPSSFARDIRRVYLHSNYENIENLRNGSDKTHHLRLTLALTALVSDSMKPKARLVLIALGFLTNKMYSNTQAPTLFDIQLSAAAAWYLAEANKEYITMKTHELLYHLADVNKLFGNTGLLSTFSFESFYQFSLCGYSTSITRFFLQNACTKFLLHTSLRREIVRRSKPLGTESLKRFLSLTPDLGSSHVTWDGRIRDVQKIDKENIPIESVLYSTMYLPLGSLISEYSSPQTNNDIVFASCKGRKTCFRFVAAVVTTSLVGALVEPIEAVSEDRKLMDLRKIRNSLSNADFYYYSEMVNQLINYDGLVEGSLSGRREVIPVDSILGVACYVSTESSSIFVQANGAYIHN
ncbi:hypothetical protein L3Y34_009831 [Caenorhabditis briggsae]|uniref:Uncharacterized protein n=1 Tax=Caenorhabditis briggsae TaxID=6238 RepID=A0AAE9A830_CAEBR|nr:hypothetical protein L3Y34_009831 [Caenorhabditis briggsae]